MSIDPLRIKAIFLKAVEQCEPGRWDAYLDEACGNDEPLRRRVEKLLEAHWGDDSLLEREHSEAPTIDQPTSEAIGSQIGPYKLLQLLGEGGMGVVYMAEQVEPVRRKVAIKLVKPGMDTQQVIARFEAERQALSLMDHPHIARVLDAGTTNGGRSYFVMELVKGQPINRYCDERRLTPRQRLELLLPVCQAVQHAHQKGIIHRDLKPSNILVAEYDERPVPKVIDFGVAKAISQPLTDRTTFTGFGQIVGTLEYMSPEQAKVNQLDIDTRSDVYSLGVVLYELLTGSTPFDKQRLRAAAWDEVLRIIREEEPPKPSTRLSEQEHSTPAVSALRRIEPEKLTNLVRGDLDWIVMKALDKDRSRRYESAFGLAADIQNYLADLPVAAGPPSAVYRLRKFARRHQRALSVVGIVLLLLAAGAVATAIGLVRAVRAERLAITALERAESERDAKQVALGEAAANARQAESARQHTREALNVLTDEVVEQWLGRQPQLGTQEQAFLRKIARYYEEFARIQGESEQARFDRADGLARVAKIQFRLGDVVSARQSFGEAVDRFKRLVAESPNAANRLGLASCLGNLAVSQRATGELAESAGCFRDSLELLHGLIGEFPDSRLYREKLGNVQNGYAVLLASTGQIQAAESALSDAARSFRDLVALAPEVPEYRNLLAGTLNNLAAQIARTGRDDQAEKLLREVIELRRPLIAQSPDMPTYRHLLAQGLYNLGNHLAGAGQIAAAESAYREAVGLLRKLVEVNPAVPRYRQDLALALSNLGNVLRSRESMDEGERAHRDAVAILRQLIDESGPVPELRNGLGVSLINLAAFYASRARPREAKQTNQQAITILGQLVQECSGVPDYAAKLAMALNALGRLENDAREFRESRALLEQSRTLLQHALDAQPRNAEWQATMHECLLQLARSLMGLRDHAAATTLIDDVVRRGHKPAFDTFNAARLYAQSIDQVREDVQLDEPGRRQRSDQYSQRAIELLRQAQQAGFTRWDLLQNEAFDSIRDRPEFRALAP